MKAARSTLLLATSLALVATLAACTKSTTIEQRPRVRQVPVEVSQKRAGSAQSAFFSQPARGWQKPTWLHSSPGGQAASVRQRHAPESASQR